MESILLVLVVHAIKLLSHISLHIKTKEDMKPKTKVLLFSAGGAAFFEW